MRRALVSLIVLAIPTSVIASSQSPQPTFEVLGATACSIVGDWSGTYPPGPYPFSGTPINFAFRADGTGESRSTRATSPVVWHMEGANLSMHGTTSGTTPYSCKREDEGKYSLGFSADCSTVTFGLVSDPCTGRATTANGMSLSRNH
jgi:hypothetical protein